MGMVVYILRVSAGQFAVRIAAAAVMVGMETGNERPVDFRYGFCFFQSAGQDPFEAFGGMDMLFLSAQADWGSIPLRQGSGDAAGQQRQRCDH